MDGKNTFELDAPLHKDFRQSSIDNLNRVDKAMIEKIKQDQETGKEPPDPFMLCEIRRYRVLLELAQTYASLWKKAMMNLPPKPTHRQEKVKSNHLRLVANGR